MNRFPRFPLLLTLLLLPAAAVFARETVKRPPLSERDRTAAVDRAKEARRDWPGFVDLKILYMYDLGIRAQIVRAHV